MAYIFEACIAISFEIGLQTAPENALKRCIFRLASAHFKSKRLYNGEARAIDKNADLKNNLFLLKKIFAYSKTLFILRIIMAMLASVSTILTILMPMYLLGALMDGDFAHALGVVGVFTAAYLFISYSGIAFSSYDTAKSEKMYLEIINEFLQKAIDLDLSYFENTVSFDKYNRSFSNCCKVIDSVNAAVTSFVTSALNILLIVGLLIWMDIYMFAVIAAVIIVTMVVNNRIKKIDYRFSVIISEKNKQVNYLYRLFYIPQMVREMKINNLSDYVFRVKRGIDKELHGIIKKQIKTKVPFNVLLSTLGILENGFVALYFGYSVVVQRIVVAEFFTYVNAYNQLKSTILGLSSIYTRLYGNSLFASDYIEFLHSEETLTLNNEGIILENVERIEFVNVSFKYPNGNHLSLDNVSFTITKGDKIAIIGRNGAGKTTIIKLLLRLYDPLSGDILINDISIKKYNTKSLRVVIKTLFQDFAIFAFSIEDNISLGEGIQQNIIWEALDKVGLKDKIESLEHSLATPISNELYGGGVELSGGEAQKLAISRIYANNPKTFIMDEPTSSLDPHSEYTLYKRLMDDVNHDSIVIVISHRLTLTYKMSKILVIDRGRLVEQGTHDELLCLKGTYCDMYSIQAEKYTAPK